MPVCESERFIFSRRRPTGEETKNGKQEISLDVSSIRSNKTIHVEGRKVCCRLRRIGKSEMKHNMGFHSGLIGAVAFRFWSFSTFYFVLLQQEDI